MHAQFSVLTGWSAQHSSESHEWMLLLLNSPPPPAIACHQNWGKQQQHSPHLFQSYADPPVSSDNSLYMCCTAKGEWNCTPTSTLKSLRGAWDRCLKWEHPSRSRMYGQSFYLQGSSPKSLESPYYLWSDWIPKGVWTSQHNFKCILDPLLLGPCLSTAYFLIPWWSCKLSWSLLIKNIKITRHSSTREKVFCPPEPVWNLGLLFTLKLFIVSQAVSQRSAEWDTWISTQNQCILNYSVYLWEPSYHSHVYSCSCYWANTLAASSPYVF